MAHRVSYEVFVGAIPKGSVVMHSCDNKRCCCPGHLTLGTQRENMLDAFKSKRRSSPMSDEIREYILSSSKSTQELSDELGMRYCRVWKLRSGKTF